MTVRHCTALLLLLPLTACGGRIAAQATPATAPSPVVVPIPAASAADVASIDAIVAALYDVISGPRNQRRDWNRFRSLFVPGGRLMPLVPRPGGHFGIHVLEVNDYIATSADLIESVGFREREVARRVEHYGNIAHVFSTYEAFQEDETEPFMRGINSLQLMNDGTRWWIVSVFWEGERPENPLPEHYLPGGTS